MCPGYSFETSKTTPIFIFPNFEDTSTDCVSVDFYQLEIQIFDGPLNAYKSNRVKFEQPYTARYFRVYPKTKYREYCMQMEFYGCTPGKGKDPIRSTLYKYIFSYTAYK